MKTIAAVYNDTSGIDSINFIEQRISEIFKGYAEVKNYFIIDLQPSDVIEADVYMLCDEELLYPMRHHFADYRNIIILKRSIGKKHIEKLMELPIDVDALVVSKTLSGTMNTINMLYDMGFSNRNLIPYMIDTKNSNEDISDVEYAITCNSSDLVPKSIKHIVDLGYRELRFETLLMIRRRLGINSKALTNRLIRYSNNIVAPDAELQTFYADSYTRGLILNRMVTDSEDIIIAVGHNGHIFYANKQANSILLSKTEAGDQINDFFDADMLSKISVANDKQQVIIEIKGTRYLTSKSLMANKPTDPDLGYYLTLQAESTIKSTATVLNNKLRDSGLYAKHSFMDIISTTPAMDDCISLSCKAAKTDYTLLLCGESGTGKELFAQSIHNYSNRKNQPFVAINCAALPETLLESELFGHEAGAYTGAGSHSKIGLFEQADKGTIFLDEIADISPKMQSSLLRVLQEKQVMKLGSNKVISIDVRVIVATNKDLLQKVKDGSFRNDLYYRLNVIRINIPPLRQRKNDILPLLRTFIGDDFNRINSKELHALSQYDWPGNVRELENACIYYRTFNTFPTEVLTSEKHPSDDLIQDAKDAPSIQFSILKLLALDLSQSPTTGRSKLLVMLREQGLQISDGKLRVIMADMQEQSLIDIGRGRQGTSLTEKGLHALNNHLI